MKQLTCEMCGGTNLVKDGGVFICQTCGCKYTVEEAKRMMIEGTVDVQGTVKVDNSEFVKKYLANARRAKEKEDWEETEKYYNMVEQNDPHNIEAIFYSAYGKAKSTLVEADLYKRQAAFKVLQNCVSIIDDNYLIDREDENKVILEQISQDILLMACSSYVYNQRKSGYGLVVFSDKLETVTLFNKLGIEFMVACENIAKKYPDEMKGKRIYFYKLALKHAQFILENGSLANPASLQKSTKTLQEWINKITIECAKKAKEDYWAEHAEEKAKLEKEKSQLELSIKEYYIEIDNLPGMSDKRHFEGQINELKKQKDALGIFKRKEKQALQKKIDECQMKIDNLYSSMKGDVDAINAKINSAKRRILDIDSTFNKERI